MLRKLKKIFLKGFVAMWWIVRLSSKRSQYIWRHRLMVRTPPFHGGNTSSNLVGVTSVRELWTERYALTQVQPHRPKLGDLHINE